MFDAIFQVALSGLNAATKRLGAAAGNIANAQNASRLEPQAGDPPAFQPQTVTQSPTVGGGVQTGLRPVTPAAIPVPDPQSPLADASGLVGLPNVDLGEQIVETLLAQRSFEANLKVVQAAQDLQDQLLDIKS